MNNYPDDLIIEVNGVSERPTVLACACRCSLVLLCYKYHRRLPQQNGQEESCESRDLAN